MGNKPQTSAYFSNEKPNNDLYNDVLFGLLNFFYGLYVVLYKRAIKIDENSQVNSE